VDTFCGCRPQCKKFPIALGVIESALLSGLFCAAMPLAGMVCAGSGPNLRSEL
jgi:hypothetical protein